MVRSTTRRGPGRPPAGEAAEGTTRTLILQHAQRLFQERGYRDVAMADIAAAVGVTSPTLYYHFAHKEALYAELVVDILRRIGQTIAQIMLETPSTAERLYRLALQRLAVVPRQGHMDTMMRDVAVHLGAAEQGRVDAAFHQHMMDPLRAIMQAGIAAGELRAGEPDLLARVWFLLLDAFVGRSDAPDPTGDERARWARQLTRLFLEGAGMPHPPVAAHRAGAHID
jgi:TetR/AcrR family transcriptional regulator